MKLRILGAALAALAVATTMGHSTQAAHSPGPYDHAWTVSLSTYAAAGNPDVTINLELGQGTPAAAPFPTTFFDAATTRYTGITPASQTIGSDLGTINFDIQTNIDPLLTGNIAATGQTPACGAPSTVHPTAAPAKIIAAQNSLTHPTVVSTLPNIVTPGYSFDQNPDLAAGGIPRGVTQRPDWYATAMSGLGIPQAAIISRGAAFATVGTAHTSVTFMTINTGGGVIAAVTILGNPIAAFNPDTQTTGTCPPFESTVLNRGVALADSWGCPGLDYFGNAMPGGCGGSTAGTGGTALTLAASGTHSYQIFLSGTANLDNDFSGSMNLFGGYDNCDIDANPTQADANSNGIGDACKAGGSWANAPTAGAVTNAGLTCGAVNTAPPWLACQDADQDGALNAGDNCPLHANVGVGTSPNVTPGDNQMDSDRDGIGDACDPAPHIAGKGNGYAAGHVPGVVTAGEYTDHDDICDSPFTIGTGAGVASCLQHVPVMVLDSNDDGYVDFLNPGAGPLLCIQDHRSDSNKDGYSDSDQSTPSGARTCDGEYPGSGGLGQNALAQCTGRNSVVAPAPGAGTALQNTNAKKAKADVDLSGAVNILDLSAAASHFLQAVPSQTHLRAEMDQNGDGQVNILDLSTMAGFFLNPVPAC